MSCEFTQCEFTQCVCVCVCLCRRRVRAKVSTTYASTGTRASQAVSSAGEFQCTTPGTPTATPNSPLFLGACGGVIVETYSMHPHPNNPSALPQCPSVLPQNPSVPEESTARLEATRKPEKGPGKEADTTTEREEKQGIASGSQSGRGAPESPRPGALDRSQPAGKEVDRPVNEVSTVSAEGRRGSTSNSTSTSHEGRRGSEEGCRGSSQSGAHCMQLSADEERELMSIVECGWRVQAEPSVRLGVCAATCTPHRSTRHSLPSSLGTSPLPDYYYYYLSIASLLIRFIDFIARTYFRIQNSTFMRWKIRMVADADCHFLH